MTQIHTDVLLMVPQFLGLLFIVGAAAGALGSILNLTATVASCTGN